MSKLIEEAITEHMGERCEDFDPHCATCEAWADYDKLTRELERVRAERDQYKQLFRHAIDQVDRVFQSCSENPKPILPDFLPLGTDKFEGVVKLAEAYTALRTAAEGAKAFVLAHETWEAHLIVDGNWGPNGLDPLPKFTCTIYDEFIEVQLKRNEVKAQLTTALGEGE